MEQTKHLFLTLHDLFDGWIESYCGEPEGSATVQSFWDTLFQSLIRADELDTELAYWCEALLSRVTATSGESRWSLIDCETSFLQFLLKHPDCTVALSVDAVPKHVIQATVENIKKHSLQHAV